MKDFTERLRLLMERGALTQADTAQLFGRERRTVASWVKDGFLPTGIRAPRAFERLKELERDVKAGRGYPVPEWLSKRNRAEYIWLLRENELESARVLAADSAPKRVVRGVRAKD